MKVESGVVVADAIALQPKRPARLRIQSALPRDEAGQPEIVKRLGERPVWDCLHDGGQFRGGFRTVGQEPKNAAAAFRPASKHGGEYIVELPEEQRARQKAHPAYVLVCGKLRFDFLKILRDAAGNRKQIEQLPG